MNIESHFLCSIQRCANTHRQDENSFFCETEGNESDFLQSHKCHFNFNLQWTDTAHRASERVRETWRGRDRSLLSRLIHLVLFWLIAGDSGGRTSRKIRSIWTQWLTFEDERRRRRTGDERRREEEEMKFTSVHSWRCCGCCSPFSLSYLYISSSRPRWTEHKSSHSNCSLVGKKQAPCPRFIRRPPSPPLDICDNITRRSPLAIRLPMVPCCFCSKYLLLFFNLIIWVRTNVFLAADRRAMGKEFVLSRQRWMIDDEQFVLDWTWAIVRI